MHPASWARALLAVPELESDHRESATRRASREIVALLHTVRFWISEVSTGAAGAVVLGAAGATAPLVLFVLILVALWITAPVRQRDEARRDLSALQQAEPGPDLEVEGKWVASHGIGPSYHVYPTGGDLIEQWLRITNRSPDPSRRASVTVTVYIATDGGEFPRSALTPFPTVPAHEKWREWPVDIAPGQSEKGIWAYHWQPEIGVLTESGGEVQRLPMRGHRAEITDHVSGRTAPIDVNGVTSELQWR